MSNKQAKMDVREIINKYISINMSVIMCVSALNLSVVENTNNVEEFMQYFVTTI